MQIIADFCWMLYLIPIFSITLCTKLLLIQQMAFIAYTSLDPIMFYCSLIARLPMQANRMRGLPKYATKIVSSWGSLGCFLKTERPIFTLFLQSYELWWWTQMALILNLALLPAMECLLLLIPLTFRISHHQSLVRFPSISGFYHCICCVGSLLYHLGCFS